MVQQGLIQNFSEACGAFAKEIFWYSLHTTQQKQVTIHPTMVNSAHDCHLPTVTSQNYDKKGDLDWRATCVLSKVVIFDLGGGHIGNRGGRGGGLACPAGGGVTAQHH
jgi:hypothetical protein